MPPRKRPTRSPPPRRSGRRAVVDSDDGQVETVPQAIDEYETEHARAPVTAGAEEAAAHNTESGELHDENDAVMQDSDVIAGGTIAERASSSLPAPSAAPLPSSSPTALSKSPPQSIAQPRTSIHAPSSTTPAATPNVPPPHSRDLTSTDPTQPRPAPTAPKFKPKAIIRRSKEERDAAERSERERVAARHGGTSERESPFGRGRGTRSGVRGGPHLQGHVYGFRGGHTTNNRDSGGSASRRGGLDARVASGPLGGATVGAPKKRARWGGQGNGVEEVDGDGGEDNDAVETVGAPKQAAKGKGKERVKEESGVKPEGGDKTGGVGLGSGTKGKRKRDSKAAGTGKATGKGRAKVKKEDEVPTYISSEGEFDSDTAEKINIEAINLVSSEEEGDEQGESDLHALSAVARGKQKEQQELVVAKATEARKARNWMNRPVHVQRLEHVERAVGVNTDASSLTSAELRRRAKERKEGEGGLFVDEPGPESIRAVRKGRRKAKDVEFVRDERKWKGVYIDDDDDEDKGEKDGAVKVKTESTDESANADLQRVLEKDDEVPGAETMEIDRIDVDAALQETTAAAGARDASRGFKALDKEPDGNIDVNPEVEDTTDEDIGFDISTDEEDNDDPDLEMGETDQDEDESYSLSKCQPEWKGLLDEYARFKDSEAATSIAYQNTTESTFKGNSEEHERARHHKTYLVQLPPLIPSLRDALKKPGATRRESKPKTEPTSASANPFNVIHSKDVAAKEETTPPPPPPSVDHQKIANAIHQPAQASDFVRGTAGTLTFYESGRTIATWGDLSFEVTKEKEALGLAQETMMMDCEKVVMRNEDRGVWEDVVTVGGKGGGAEEQEEDDRRVGYSGGRVGSGFCLLGA